MTTEDQQVVQKLYADYAKWKTHYVQEATGFRAEQYAEEMKRAQLSPPARIVEIGFGAGGFLDWARETGFNVSGIEINESFAAAARKRGHDVLVGSIEQALPSDESIDAIVLFDVFEHMTLVELEHAFQAFQAAVVVGGKIVARFPNGASPFGRLTQYGDLTHRLVLTPNTVEQLGASSSFRLLQQFNAARPMQGAGHSWKDSRVARRIVYAIRDLINTAVGMVYFGRAIPLDPNVTVVFERVA